MNLGEFLLGTGDTAGARAALERATEIFGQQDGSPIVRAFLLMHTALCDVAEGLAARSIALLEQSLAIIDGYPCSTPLERAEARFSLARALRAAGLDRERARALAEASREGFDWQGWCRVTVADVDAWLAADGAAP